MEFILTSPEERDGGIVVLPYVLQSIPVGKDAGDQVEETETTKGGKRLFMSHGRGGKGGFVRDSCQTCGCGRGRRNRSDAAGSFLHRSSYL